MPRSSTYDVAIVGGGAIGLMLAWQLARRGQKVAVLDRQELGKESSWAGAGIIYPARWDCADAPFAKLRAQSYQRWPTIAAELLEITGIDTGFRQTGGVILPSDDEPLSAKMLAEHQTLGAEIKPGVPAELEPSLSLLPDGSPRPIFFVPGACQVRNPWLLQALSAACQIAGVTLLPFHEVKTLRLVDSTARGLITHAGVEILADQTVICAGAWSANLLKEIGIQLPVKPILGQIHLLQTEPGTVRHIVEVGKRYLVPRTDGRLLIGATEEDTGFAKSITESAQQELRRFGEALFPALRHAKTEKMWAGLRPGSPTGTPFLTTAPGVNRLFISTGHYRLGLQLSVGSADLLADWITSHSSFAVPADFGFDDRRPAYSSAFA